MKKKLKLILPNKKYAASYLKGAKEYKKDKTQTAARHADLLKSLKDFPVYNKKIVDDRKGINLGKGRVPATLYWTIVGKKFVGRLHLRHRLNKNLYKMGGHIGYAVIPSERRKGYATEMLRLGLKKAKKLGIKKALLTCDETNIASRKVIEANGGKFINKTREEGVFKLRFWVPTL
jgi:predicted acetyltransferase